MWYTIDRETGFKISKYSIDELYMVITTIKWLREMKYFWLADYLREQLVEIGYYWYMPDGPTKKSDLLGHTREKLEFGIDKDGTIECKGYIHYPKFQHQELYLKL